MAGSNEPFSPPPPSSINGTESPLRSRENRKSCSSGKDVEACREWKRTCFGAKPGIVLPPARLQLYMAGTITFINQVYMGFRATVADMSCDPGVESMDCRFFTREECPWDEVAYPQVNDSILQAYDDLDSGRFDVWHAEMTEDRYDLRPVSRT